MKQSWRRRVGEGKDIALKGGREQLSGQFFDLRIRADGDGSERNEMGATESMLPGGGSARSGRRAEEIVRADLPITHIVTGLESRNRRCIIIPAEAVEIAGGAFQQCRQLKRIYFAGNGLRTIGGDAFAYCVRLHELRLPRGLRVISDAGGLFGGAFYSCTGLMGVFVPRTVVRIGSGAFAWTSSLEGVRFERGSELTVIGDECFQNSGLRSIDVPASVAKIGGRAFFGCTRLQRVAFARDSRLQCIGDAVFAGATALDVLRAPVGFDDFVRQFADVPSKCKIEEF